MSLRQLCESVKFFRFVLFCFLTRVFSSPLFWQILEMSQFLLTQKESSAYSFNEVTFIPSNFLEKKVQFLMLIIVEIGLQLPEVFLAGELLLPTVSSQVCFSFVSDQPGSGIWFSYSSLFEEGSILKRTGKRQVLTAIELIADCIVLWRFQRKEMFLAKLCSVLPRSSS